MEIAPVIIFTYNRLEHTKQTIEALMENYLADKSDIYIFSDGPKGEIDEKEVSNIRQYINSLMGFKSITIVESKSNNGLANSVIQGVTEVINKYGKAIVLEDDIVTSRYFLKYMNEALELFEDRMDIWSISGYIPNIKIPNDYNDEICLIRRASSWGWATWKNRWELNDWDVKDYLEFRKDKQKVKEFNQAGNDMTFMLDDQMDGRINSWAIRWAYNQYKNNMWTVFPIKSMVKNIGNDLSGTHSSRTNKYDVILSQNNLKLNKKVKINEEICINYKKFNDLNIWGYVAVIIKKIGFYRQARKFRNYLLKYIFKYR